MTDAAPPVTLRLKDVSDSHGRTLGLRGGDVLVAVNGRAFHGDAAAFPGVFTGKPVALTFLRGGAEWTLLADRPDLGRWETVPALAEANGPERRRIDPAALRVWAVMRADDGRYDLCPQHLSPLAWIAPQLWLMQMRLWLPCAMLLAAVVAGFVVHPLLALAVQAAGAVHLRAGHLWYLRQDRHARGLGFHIMLAAAGEAAAHRAYRVLHSDDSYLFAPSAKAAETAAA